MKNRILLENYYLPGELEVRLAQFIDFYNTRRYHESLGNLTPADIYFGRGSTILARRQKIKQQTIQLRRRLHQQAVASTPTRWLISLFFTVALCRKWSDEVQRRTGWNGSSHNGLQPRV